MLARRFAVVAGVFAIGFAGCTKRLPPPDPNGADIVDGTLVAAAEPDGAYRVYKVLKVQPFPPPMTPDYHVAAYDPKAPTPEEARELHDRGALKVALAHFVVRSVRFLPRPHRIIGHEAVTDEERAHLK